MLLYVYLYFYIFIILYFYNFIFFYLYFYIFNVFNNLIIFAQQQHRFFANIALSHANRVHKFSTVQFGYTYVHIYIYTNVYITYYISLYVWLRAYIRVLVEFSSCLTTFILICLQHLVEHQ